MVRSKQWESIGVQESCTVLGCSPGFENTAGRRKGHCESVKRGKCLALQHSAKRKAQLYTNGVQRLSTDLPPASEACRRRRNEATARLEIKWSYQ